MSTPPFRHHRISLLALLTVGMVLSWLLLFPSYQPITVQLSVPSSVTVGVPVSVEALVNAPWPQSLHVRLSSSTHSGWTLSHRPANRFFGFSWRGPLWCQRYDLFATTLSPLVSEDIVIGSTRLSLPGLTPQLPASLPEAPAFLPQSPSAMVFSPWYLLLLVVPLTLVWAVAWHRSPRHQLHHLPLDVASLDRLPSLLRAISPSLTARYHPDFFSKLNDLRFSPKPPTQDQLSALLTQARQLTQSTH